MTTNKEELHATITARAELDRAFARLLVEDAAAVMSKNMLHVFDLQEQRATEQRAQFEESVKGAISAALVPLMGEFHALEQRMSVSEAEHARAEGERSAMIGRVEQLNADFQAFRAMVEERLNNPVLTPAQIHHYVELIEAHEAKLGGGDAADR